MNKRQPWARVGVKLLKGELLGERRCAVLHHSASFFFKINWHLAGQAIYVQTHRLKIKGAQNKSTKFWLAEFVGVVEAVPVCKGISASANVLIVQLSYRNGLKPVRKARGPGGIAHPMPAWRHHPAALITQYWISKRKSKKMNDGDGNGLNRDAWYPDVLSVCAN